MRNRFRMTAKQAELAARYGIDPIYPEDATFPPPELFPKKSAYVVREELGRPRLEVMGWGFPRKCRARGSTRRPASR